MEMMSRPSKEVLVFSKNIRKWIIGDKTISGKEAIYFQRRYSARCLRFVPGNKTQIRFCVLTF